MIQIKNFPLSHGQAELVLWDPLWGGKITDDFKAQIKYLRTNGIPKVSGDGPGTTIYYNFTDIMELALALAIRGQGFNVKDMDTLFKDYRKTFHKMFEQTYEASQESKKLYLKLGLKYRVYRNKGTFSHTEPQLLGEDELSDIIAESGSWFTGVFSITKMVQDICERAETVPEVRRGRS